jgi:hypothetical protein
MAIGAKPKRNQADIAPVSEDAALKFIEGAGREPEPEPAKVTSPAKARAEAKPILVRGIDGELLERLDREAARRRVSRAAMVQMLLVEHLPE